MCKPSCCSPKGSSGIAGLIAAAAGIIIAANVLPVLLGMLITLLEIIVITTAVLAVLSLAAWALVRHRRRVTAATRSAVPAWHPTALRPAHAPALPGRARPGDHELAVRHFAEVIASYDDPAAVEALIARALHERRSRSIPHG